MPDLLSPYVEFHSIITIRYTIKEIVHKTAVPIDYQALTYSPFFKYKHTLAVEPKNYASNGGMCKLVVPREVKLKENQILSLYR
jgi:hypothetical protein